MILKCNNKKSVNLVKDSETLDFAYKLKLNVDMLERFHVSVSNDKVLDILKRLLGIVDENYRKTKLLNLLNYKHLLLVSAQVMKLPEYVLKIVV